MVRLFSVRESNNPPFSLTFPQSTSAFSQFRRHLLSGSFVSYESSARNVGSFFQKLRETETSTRRVNDWPTKLPDAPAPRSRPVPNEFTSVIDQPRLFGQVGLVRSYRASRSPIAIHTFAIVTRIFNSRSRSSRVGSDFTRNRRRKTLHFR